MIVHKWKFVDSSAIQAVSYDRKNKVLHVMFRQGTVYSYPRIGAHRYSKLIHAESVGKYFNEAIRPKGESKNDFKKTLSDDR